MITYTHKLGNTITEACAQAVVLARLNRDTIQFQHDSVTLEATHNDTGWKLEQQFHEAKRQQKPAQSRKPYAD